MLKYINSKRIQKFVTSIEKKKRFKRDPNLIIRHLFEEIGECSHALWLAENPETDGLRESRRRDVGRELCDIISLAVYLADVLGLDLNDIFQINFEEVARKYNVKFIRRE